jgi:Holliday junction resolvase-like predicted endonuclease
MPKPRIQQYYCIIKKKKFGEYDCIIRENTSTAKVRNQLKKEGYRVLVCVTAHGLLKLQQAENFEEFLKERPTSKWTEEAFNFMKGIKVSKQTMIEEIYDFSSLYPSIMKGDH